MLSIGKESNMQNEHIDDLVNGEGKREGYSKTIYLRKDDLLRIQDVQQAGYVLIEQGTDTQDMSLYGLPEGSEGRRWDDVKQELKKEGDNVTQGEATA